MEPRRAWWDSTPSPEGRIQGGSRHTYNAPVNRDASHVFMESDGRPLDVEFELWDGPNNTPTRMKVYSEDGRMRPINATVENPQRGQRGNTLSIRNTGPVEFSINAEVSSMGGGAMMSPSGIRRGGLAGSEGAYLTEHDLDGFTRPSSPSMARGETVQGGALRTFPLDYSVEAVQVTIRTDGLPMNAKVELWGTSSHIKQVAEIYNDNGKDETIWFDHQCPWWIKYNCCLQCGPHGISNPSGGRACSEDGRLGWKRGEFWWSFGSLVIYFI